MSCPSCGDRNVGQIRFSVVASGVSFHYCRRCENRWWTAESSHLELDEVLQAAAVLGRAS